MRSRKKTYTQDVLQNSPFMIKDTEAVTPATWVKPPFFTQSQPIHLEIGTGKGNFITGMSNLHPTVNFVGMEREKEIIVMAARKLEHNQATQNTSLQNAILVHGDASNLNTYFAPASVSRIYLNFSDPWPKSRNAKRRLTYRSFLDIYKGLLVADGELHFKTDNMGLFDFSLEEFAEKGWQSIFNTRDLHQESFHLEGHNVTTEYEQRFSDLGQPIYRACYVKPRD